MRVLLRDGRIIPAVIAAAADELDALLWYGEVGS